jgi:hypothetical protein
LKLSCHFEGYPQPSLQWFKDDEALTMIHDVSQRIFWLKSNTSMVFTRLEMADVGNYSCVVKNCFGIDVLSTVVDVSGEFWEVLRRNRLQEASRSLQSQASRLPTSTSIVFIHF